MKGMFNHRTFATEFRKELGIQLVTLHLYVEPTGELRWDGERELKG